MISFLLQTWPEVGRTLFRLFERVGRPLFNPPYEVSRLFDFVFD
jgi:hypothetical protein